MPAAAAGRVAAARCPPVSGALRTLCPLLREVQVVEVGVRLEGEGQTVQLRVQGHHRALGVNRDDRGVLHDLLLDLLDQGGPLRGVALCHGGLDHLVDVGVAVVGPVEVRRDAFRMEHREEEHGVWRPEEEVGEVLGALVVRGKDRRRAFEGDLHVDAGFPQLSLPHLGDLVPLVVGLHDEESLQGLAVLHPNAAGSRPPASLFQQRLRLAEVEGVHLLDGRVVTERRFLEGAVGRHVHALEQGVDNGYPVGGVGDGPADIHVIEGRLRHVEHVHPGRPGGVDQEHLEPLVLLVALHIAGHQVLDDGRFAGIERRHASAGLGDDLPHHFIEIGRSRCA